jgi:hypothetical protein
VRAHSESSACPIEHATSVARSRTLFGQAGASTPEQPGASEEHALPERTVRANGIEIWWENFGMGHDLGPAHTQRVTDAPLEHTAR